MAQPDVLEAAADAARFSVVAIRPIPNRAAGLRDEDYGVLRLGLRNAGRW